jgi:hypothetical protein
MRNLVIADGARDKAQLAVCHNGRHSGSTISRATEAPAGLAYRLPIWMGLPSGHRLRLSGEAPLVCPLHGPEPLTAMLNKNKKMEAS